jgi:hypothetical protein
VDCDETRAAAETVMTPPERLFLHFGTGIMALQSDAVFIPKYAGKDIHPPEKRVSPNTASIAAPERRKNFDTNNTKVNYELSNETNLRPCAEGLRPPNDRLKFQNPHFSQKKTNSDVTSLLQIFELSKLPVAKLWSRQRTML